MTDWWAELENELLSCVEEIGACHTRRGRTASRILRDVGRLASGDSGSRGQGTDVPRPVGDAGGPSRDGRRRHAPAAGRVTTGLDEMPPAMRSPRLQAIISRDFHPLLTHAPHARGCDGEARSRGSSRTAVATVVAMCCWPSRARRSRRAGPTRFLRVQWHVVELPEPIHIRLEGYVYNTSPLRGERRPPPRGGARQRRARGRRGMGVGLR